MTSVLENSILQLMYLLGFIVLGGLIIWYLDKAIYKIMGPKGGRKMLITSGVIGVPIHEFGHAFFCVVFRHKITGIKFFQAKSPDGVLGYVRHTYNPKSTYQKVGNFFIGIGPILFGGAVVLLLLLLFLPSLFSVAVSGDVIKTFGALYALENMLNPFWWIFILLASSISMHMSLSAADLKGSARGFIYIAIMVLGMNLLVYLFDPSVLGDITKFSKTVGLTLGSFLATAVIILIAFVLRCLAMKYVFKLQKKVFKPRTKTGGGTGDATEPMVNIPVPVIEPFMPVEEPPMMEVSLPGNNREAPE